MHDIERLTRALVVAAADLRPISIPLILDTASGLRFAIQIFGTDYQTPDEPRDMSAVVADLSWKTMPSASFALVDEQPDRTLDELVAAMHERRSAERTWRERGAVGFGSKAFLIRRDWCLSMRLRPASIWTVSGDVARVASE